MEFFGKVAPFQRKIDLLWVAESGQVGLVSVDRLPAYKPLAFSYGVPDTCSTLWLHLKGHHNLSITNLI